MGLFDLVKHVGKAVTDLGKGIAHALEDTATAIAAPVVEAGSSLLEDLVEWGEKALEQVAGWLEEIGIEKILTSAHSPILLAGQVMIANMRRTTGSGEPENGAQFGTGAQRFTEAAQVLAAAGPTGDWTGSASGAYRADNDHERECATAMAHADQGVQQVLTKEAGQIKSSRGKLDDQSNWLADVGLTTLSMFLLPGIGLALKTAAEVAAVNAAVKACQDELDVLRGEVSANASAIKGLTANYRAVVDHAQGGLQGPGSVPPGGGGGGDYGPSGTNGNGTGRNGAGRNGSGGGTGSGGVASQGGGAPAYVPTPSAPVVPMPKMPQAPGAMWGTSSGLPAAGGAPPPAPGAPPLAMGGGGVPTGLAEMVQAAVQRAMDQRDVDKASDAKKAGDEQKDADGDGVPDAEDEDVDGDGVPDAEDEDVDGDGVPDAVMVARAGSDAASAGRAPVHVEIDVDLDRLNTPMTVTLDRDRPIVVTPAMAT